MLLGGGSIGIGIDPQTQTPGVQGLGMQSLGGLRGTTRLGLGASGGGIFDIHIAVLPPSRRFVNNRTIDVWSTCIKFILEDFFILSNANFVSQTTS